MSNIHVKITLAREFGSRVQEELETYEFWPMLDRNKAATDPNVCHTHDHCDANALMADAFRTVIGRDPAPDSDVDQELWNDAWAIAKAADFFA